MYRGQCAEFCGLQHANMKIVVFADSDEDFRAWLARERGPARVTTTAEAQQGEQLFTSGRCGGCHTVRGSPALGQLGPDLTHVASRQTIAAGALPNDTADLAAWITHAQSLKPGGLMPDLPQFTGKELRALVAYLQQLR